jgi:hypothetical protein
MIESITVFVFLGSIIKHYGISMWKLWAKALGEKASDNDTEADKIACIRTAIVLVYIITNLFIIAGIIRHW